MRILYGVCGEGFGHSSRALFLANYLKEKGNEVKIVTYGQAYPVLKKDFDVFKVKGLHLIFEKSKLSKHKTFNYNFNNFLKNFSKLKKFHKLMLNFKPDLCISDMEPIVPILSFWYKVPLISFDNQHRITNLEIKIPKKYCSDYIAAREVVNTFVRSADYFVVTSFGNIKINKKNTLVTPPIIRESVKRLKPKSGEKILVYLTKKDKTVLNILKKINECFIVYGYDKSKKIKNLEFKKRDSFLNDLKDCKAIIATSGFTLMSEALYLKKPYFALPLRGQFEQVLNALFLKQSKFGDYSDSLKLEEVNNFLTNLKIYKKNLKRYNPDFDKTKKVFDKILKKYK